MAQQICIIQNLKIMNELKEALTPVDNGNTKIRIGHNRDGGYVVSKECVDESQIVFSLGIGDGSPGQECECDKQLADEGKQIFMYESAYDEPPIKHENFHFNKLFVTSDNFKTEIQTKHPDTDNMLLMMDIEGGEYELLSNIDDEILTKFSQICFEIHWMHRRTNDVISIINKLKANFDLIHIHGNNYAYILNGMPDVIELTFVRKDKATSEIKPLNIGFPLPGLDFPNNPNEADYQIDWWINK
jgi:hypothetical protein